MSIAARARFWQVFMPVNAKEMTPDARAITLQDEFQVLLKLCHDGQHTAMQTPDLDHSVERLCSSR